LASPADIQNTGSFEVVDYIRSIKRPREDAGKPVAIFMPLESLPTELLWHTVTVFLGAKDICFLSETCRFFVGLAKSEQLWKALFFRDFRLDSIQNRFLDRFPKSWLWLYRSKAVSSKYLHAKKKWKLN